MNRIIKICGVQSAEAVVASQEAGATTVGFNLTKSRRRVSLEDIVRIRNSSDIKSGDSVAVVVNECASTLVEWRERTRVAILQLSGDESPEILGDLDGIIWKVLRFGPGTTSEHARFAIDPWLSGPRPVEHVLVDAAVAGAYGGTGHKADWDLVAKLAEEFPVILAGGLTPSNVAEAIRIVQPAGVDVASGVERDGQKDNQLIAAFVAEARTAYEDSDASSKSSVDQFSSK